MTQRVACYALHYGLEYLPWSIRSVQEAVDEIHIWYSEGPSFGFKGPERCHETRDQLQEAAHRFANKPIIWHDGSWPNEGHHRNAMLEGAKKAGARTALIVDADELWHRESLHMALDHVESAASHWRWQAHFQNFFRTVRHEVHDQFLPFRVVDLSQPGPPMHRDACLPTLEESGIRPVLHFGYAQSLKLMNYKWTCHGHQAELRPGWWSRFTAWTPGLQTTDLHPTVNHLWEQATRVDAATDEVVAKLLHDHPYLQLELVT